MKEALIFECTIPTICNLFQMFRMRRTKEIRCTRKQRRIDLFPEASALPSQRASSRGREGEGASPPSPPRANTQASALPITSCFLAAHESFLCSTQSERMHMDKSKLLARVQMNVASLALRTQMMDQAGAYSRLAL